MENLERIETEVLTQFLYTEFGRVGKKSQDDLDIIAKVIAELKRRTEEGEETK